MGDTNIIGQINSKVSSTPPETTPNGTEKTVRGDNPPSPGPSPEIVTSPETRDKLAQADQALSSPTRSPEVSAPTPTLPKPAAEVAAAGTTSAHNAVRERRHFRQNLFEDGDMTWYGYRNPNPPPKPGPAAGLGRPPSHNELTRNDSPSSIFLVDGSRNLRLPRHRDPVKVFPAGCMGITDETEEPGPKPAVSPRANPDEDILPSKIERNPLTGAGCDNYDFIRRTPMGKNGEDDKGKDTGRRNKKVPPGGFSTRLW